MMKVVSVLAAIVALGSAIPAPDESLNTCELCVGAGKAWNGGECLDSCMIMDVGCYEDTKGCDAYNEMQLMIRECPQQGSCKGCLSHNRFCKFGKNDGKCAMRDGFYDWSAYVQESTDCDCLCPKNLDPVCGSDGVTYGNACEAACAEVSTTDGACVVEEACSCAEIWSPVCADGKTYGNECEAKCANVETFTQGECPKPVCVLKNGTKIPQGDSWKASDCEHCQCSSSDTGPKIECYMQDCAPPQECEDGFENQKVEGQCCHQCQKTQTTYDCSTDEDWTDDKRKWCCDNEGQGCEDPCALVLCATVECKEGYERQDVEGECCDTCQKKEDPCALVDCMDVECTAQEISFTPEGECCSECKKCDDVVDCFADPCATSTCSVAGATCESNYCGGCNAVWSVKGEVLDEKQCAPEYNCQTEELWTNEKKNWCCEHEDECAQKCSTVRCILGAACDDTEEWYRPFGQCCSSCKPKESDCDGTVVACLVRPCSVTTCDAHPDAVCADDYCDGCNAIFTLDGEVLSKDECEKEKPEFDCQTRELWTNEKQVWCCENEERGCDGVCETSDGDMYALGASWQPDACTYCSCDDPGTAKKGICAVMDCMPPLCGLDEEMVTQEGKCCPTCVKKVVESSECPANCGDGTCKGDQCTSCGTQNKAIAKGTDADGFFGKCLNTLYCDSNKIVQNTANAGKPCKCSLSKCQYCVTKGAEQEVCKKCQSGFYLLDGECVESCSDEHAAVGINEVGRKCMEPFSCVKGRMVGGGGGKCKCTTPDNGFHRTCHACRFQAGGIGDVCTKCKSGKFLNPATAQCQDACDGLAGLIHYGDKELGNECRKPFTCANGLDEDSRKCKCSSASGGRKCASCEWGADGDTCTLCKRGAYLHNGVCVKQCPQGTTEVGTKTVGRVCE
eukprot:m.224844 g.224844  ORF g.224844 m.224844 type:complete len:905 (+) comp33446_c0_seq1:159-2873(+)